MLNQIIELSRLLEVNFFYDKCGCGFRMISSKEFMDVGSVESELRPLECELIEQCSIEVGSPFHTFLSSYLNLGHRDLNVLDTYVTLSKSDGEYCIAYYTRNPPVIQKIVDENSILSNEADSIVHKINDVSLPRIVNTTKTLVQRQYVKRFIGDRYV